MSHKLNRVRKNIHYLRALHDSKPKLRRAIIKDANKELIDTICECLHNIIKGNVKVSPSNLKQLKRHQRLAKELHCKRTGINRKKIILQNGGFLSAILAPLIGGVIAPLLGGLLNR